MPPPRKDSLFKSFGSQDQGANKSYKSLIYNDNFNLLDNKNNTSTQFCDEPENNLSEK